MEMLRYEREKLWEKFWKKKKETVVFDMIRFFIVMSLVNRFELQLLRRKIVFLIEQELLKIF